VEDGSLRSYVGGWPEYVRIRAERAEDERTAKRAKPADAKASKPKPASNGGGPSKNQVRRAKDLEKAIERAEAELQAIERELADPSAWNDPRSAAKSTKRHAAAKKAVEELYAEWESVAG
jgi:ATP-binding cassette, subfamily F, member 3